MECHEGSGHQQHEGCKKRKRQNWTDLETSVLVECKDKHGENESRYFNGTPAVTDWEAIGREIADRLGSKSIAKSGEQCRQRWETLVKAYKKVRKHCKYVGKEYSELTRTEKVELKLATTLKDEWYEVIDQWYGTDFRCAKSKSGQVDNDLPTLVQNPCSPSSCDPAFDIPTTQHESRSLNRGQPLIEAMAPLHLLHGCNTHEIGDLNHVGSHTPTQFESGSTLVRNSETLEKEDGDTPVTPECTTMNDALNPIAPESPIPSERLNQKSRLEIVTIPEYNSMDRDLKSTFLNLIFKASWRIDFRIMGCGFAHEMEGLCRWLAYVQGMRLLEVRVQVHEFVRLKLVTFCKSDDSRTSLDLSSLREFKQYLEKVVRTHFSRLDADNESTLDSSLLTDRLTVVALVGCKVLKKVDLGNLPKLRSLVIMKCCELNEVCGWEYLRELEWLEISNCDSYHDCPKYECLPSLKEAHFGNVRWTDETWFKLDFSQCVQLRGLGICNVSEMKKIRDLSPLKCLEELTLNNCDDLESIVGLSGLHSLSLLDLQYCRALKRVPDLSHLTSLVELDLTGSGVDEISGVEKLVSLTRLLLHRCDHLKRVPDLGFLTALAHLDISVTEVDEIPGVLELVNLKTLNCYGSKMERLPDLCHLPRLEWVDVEKTPLSQLSTSIYVGKGKVGFNEDLDV